MKKLVVTGARGDLGEALIASFSGPEWMIGAPNRNELDVTNLMAIQNYFELLSLDLLVCAAGIIDDAPLARISENKWDKILAVNFLGALNCATAVLPKMIEQKNGHIVFISSYSGRHPAVGQAAYAASKAALLGLTSNLAAEYGSFNIRVNSILPGFMETKMTKNVSKIRKDEILEEHFLGRFNTPVAVAKFIYYLHENLPHTSGQFFQLDSRIF